MTEALARAMRRLEAEPILFAERPSRIDLARLELPNDPFRCARVQVFRNHAIEPILAFAGPFAAHARIDFEFALTDYDDSLSFATRAHADAYVLHLDLARYASLGDADARARFLESRAAALRVTTSAPIVLVLLGERGAVDAARARLLGVSDAHVVGVDELAGTDGPLVDDRTAAVTGTRIRTSLHARIARALVASVLPAVLVPPIKAVVVDLDETLYRGVLGEDGASGVELTDAHRALQVSLVALRDRGIFLGLATRNEPTDVATLFATRTDFPLRMEHFSATEISWGDKSNAIARIAEQLRIATDSILFVDDNPGELANVIADVPSIHAIHANRDARVTERAIALHPGVRRLASTATDSLRVADAKGNDERARIAHEATDDRAYFESLEITIRRRYDDRSDLPRLAELCRKTNQFNLCLGRFSEAELEKRMADSDAFVAAIELEDRISRSGTIGVVVGRRDGSTLVVEELCVSCRAMGRRIDDAVVLPALLGTRMIEGCDRVAFRVAHAARNRPALDWLSRHLGTDSPPFPGLHEVSRSTLEAFPLPGGVTLREESSSNGSK